MKRQEIFEKVQAIVAVALAVEQKEVDWDFPLFEVRRQTHFFLMSPLDVFNPHFISSLNDGMDEVEICMELEEEFDIEIPDEAAEQITTVQEAVDYINNKVATSA